MDKSTTVLYVEDNPENRLLVRRILQAEGYQVIEADSATQAWEALSHHAPDLILMDINLPAVDGYTLTSRLKSLPQYCQIPIIAITANVMRGDRERTIDAGCDGYIQKPIDVDNLPHQLNRYLMR